MDLGLQGHRAVVTGASKGIGAAVVRSLASEGVDVAFCARHTADLDEVAAGCAGLPGSVHPFVADMGDGASVAAFCDAAEAAIGAPDILVNNVGASPSRNFLYLSDEEWEELMRLNLLSAVRTTRRFLPAMRAGGWGRVVMVSTAGAKYPSPALIDYAASKAAMIATAKALSKKYGPDGILVNSVLPGLIRTPMWERAAAEVAEATGRSVEDVFTGNGKRVPVGRYGRAEEVADVITFLCSDRASYVSGVSIEVDGGVADHIF